MSAGMAADMALKALLMALWQRKLIDEVMILSDQNGQFSSDDWQSFLRAHKLRGSMSQLGNSHENAAAESFFQLIKRERNKQNSTSLAKMQDVMCRLHRDVSQTKTAIQQLKWHLIMIYEEQYFMRLLGCLENPGRLNMTITQHMNTGSSSPHYQSGTAGPCQE
jgi:transposase InsO family protein